MYFNFNNNSNNNPNNNFNNRNNNYNNRNNNYNNYNNNYYNRNNMYNNKQNNNQQSPKGQSPNITSVFLTLLLVLTALIMVFHVVNVIDTNNKLKEENSEKKDNNQNNNDNSEIIIETPIDEEDEEEEETSVEDKNKDELVKLCKKIDSNGSYNYDEYVKYVDSFDATGLSDSEIYEIMSKKTYCYEGTCVKIEKEGLINYVECSSGEYTRITFTEYEKIKEAQTKIDEALTNACSSVNDEGYFDSGAATGIRVTCDNFVCLTEYDDEIITKKCK